MKILRNYIALIFLVSIFLDANSKTIRQDSMRNLNRHDFVAHGNHANELGLGNYVVVATALNEEDARQSLIQFKKLNYPEPSYGYLSNKSLWYIGYGSFAEIDEAKQKRNEYRQFQLFKNAYLLTVHKSRDEEEQQKIYRHEFVRKGNHLTELGIGDYVIVGVFQKESTSQNFVDQLKKLDFNNAAFGYLTEKKLWYAYFGDYKDIDSAKTELEKYRQMKMFKDAWLLTVHQ